MSRGNRFWNGRLAGISGAGMQVLGASVAGLLDAISTSLTRRNLGSVGKGVVIQRGVVVRYPGQIELGDDVRIGRQVHIVTDSPGARVVVGRRTWIGRRCRLDFTGGLIIGEDCVLSEHVTLLTHDHGLAPHSRPQGRMLRIGHRVWIGADVTVLPQVSEIGDDSIIGAGSVLTASVPSAVVVAGNPARIIRANAAPAGTRADST